MITLHDAQTFCTSDARTLRHVREIYLPRVQSEIKQLERMIEQFPMVADKMNTILQEQKAVLNCIIQRLWEAGGCAAEICSTTLQLNSILSAWGSDMKERPILFSAPMVRAILEGRKTQTRRTYKLEVINLEASSNKFDGFVMLGKNLDLHSVFRNKFSDVVSTIRCPYGKVGDRLWVRESWHIEARRQSESHLNMTVAYRPCSPRAVENGWPQDSKDFDLPAETPIPSPNVPTFGKSGIRWRPSIHMPRWASRITLEITDIRVERLNDISEQDAIAEGIELRQGPERYPMCPMWKLYDETNMRVSCPIASFRSLWESINGTNSFDDRWVWVICFKRVAP